MKTKNTTTENVMRKIKIEKVVLNVSGIGEYLEKGTKLLERLTGKKPCKTRSTKRIPTLGVRPGLEIGVVVTIRDKPEEVLRRMLIGVENILKKKQISVNNFSFGIKEYLELPGVEYQRDIGIMGFDVTVVFKRVGRRVGIRKIKRNKIPQKQKITPEEIIKFMEENFQTNFI